MKMIWPSGSATLKESKEKWRCNILLDPRSSKSKCIYKYCRHLFLGLNCKFLLIDVKNKADKRM